MVLKLRVKLCRGVVCVESIGIANSGFASRDLEIVAPENIVKTLIGENIAITLVDRVLADGSRTALPRTVETLDLYIVAEDRVEGPVKTHAYLSKGRFILISDSVLSKLQVVIIDPYEGIWCFRDEIGKRERKGL